MSIECCIQGINKNLYITNSNLAQCGRGLQPYEVILVIE
jgi:hypothetical protein